jgi:hypothetical protein
VVIIFAFPRSKSGIFDLTLNKVGRFWMDTNVTIFNDVRNGDRIEILQGSKPISRRLLKEETP